MAGRKVLLNDVIAVVLAGGQGERLYPLTRDRSKPAVPFGGHYRIIDFTLSNCINSGLRTIYVLTQYKSFSLERHIKRGWDPLVSANLGEFIYTVPPQLRVGQRWYEGTADAVYQNLYLIKRARPNRLIVLSGDHVYRMDYGKFVHYHEKRKAVATVGAVEVPIESASAFGVIEVDDNWRITSFREKPLDPKPMPGKPDKVLVNMGVYCFETQAMISSLCDDAGVQGSRHDFGHDILPSLLDSGKLFAYPFRSGGSKADLYWRDIGTLDSYYDASMDLVSVAPQFNLYDTEWPVLTLHRQLPPAKTVFAQVDKPRGRVGMVLDSIVCGGSIVSGGKVERSVLSPEVRVNSYAQVTKSVLMDNVVVGREARVRNAIVDKNVKIPARFVIGEDPDEDRRRFKVTEGGVVVIPRNADLER